MAFASRTNAWASRLIIVIQLIVWTTVGIILLLKGVSSMQRRKAETINRVIETDPSVGNISTETTFVRRIETGYELTQISDQERLIDKKVGLTNQIDPESALRSDQNRSKQNEIGSVIEHVPGERRSSPSSSEYPELATNLGRGWSSSTRVHPLEVNKRTDTNIRNALNQIAGINPDREYVQGFEGFTSESVSINENKTHDAREEVLNSTDISPEIVSTWQSTDDGDRITDTSWENENRTQYSSWSWIAVILIGTIMLIVVPIMVILRLLEIRRARKQRNESPIANVSEDSLPTYDQAILMDTLPPSYSLLSLSPSNEDINRHDGHVLIGTRCFDEGFINNKRLNIRLKYFRNFIRYSCEQCGMPVSRREVLSRMPAPDKYLSRVHTFDRFYSEGHIAGLTDRRIEFHSNIS